jgi:thiamine-monophosphate kinase
MVGRDVDQPRVGNEESIPPSYNRGVNEFELIDRFFRRPPRSSSVALGVGDDAALLVPTSGRQIVASVDMLVGGRHFFADVDPKTLGHKALAVNLSDLAAMGATPKWALLALALPDDDPTWLASFASGFCALADAHDVDLVGGDTTRGPRNVCVTILGEVPVGQAVTRAGAVPGDDVYVSGMLGDAALALAAISGRTLLDPLALAACRLRLERPTARIALGERLRGVVTAMLDVSDGLIGDLGHILDASNVGAIVDLASIPRSPALAAKLEGDERALALHCLLAGGDDYELCFTAPPMAKARLAAIATEIALPLSRIGTISAGHGLVIRDQRNSPLADLPRAFDHFADDAP